MNDKTTNTGGLFMLGTTLALGLVITALIMSDAFKTVKLSNQSITVKGYAEKKIMSDFAVWRGSFSHSSPDLVNAYDKLQQDLNKTLDYLKRTGVKSPDINISSVNTTTRYKLNEKGYKTNQIDEYILTQHVEIKSSDIRLIEKLSKESTSLIKEGITFNSEQPEFYFTKINDLKIEMLAEATKDARIRAEQLAQNSGSQVGALKSASQGVFQITSINSTEVSDYGLNDVSSIEKMIKAVVTIDYLVK